MPDYIQILFRDLQPEQIDLLVAQLSDAGFEGFEEEEDILKAFIQADFFEPELLNEISFKYQLPFDQSVIEPVNWNEEWESSFEPVRVDDFVLIRADFHQSDSTVQFDIIITPKMSFGTGHHATTYMMIKQMREINFAGKSVLDFGTGTGILAILAEKSGADHVFAIDHDAWSFENAAENLKRNKAEKIRLELTTDFPQGKKFDLILANINKNVILESMSAMKAQLNSAGEILLSGLLLEDKAEILESAISNHMTLKNELVRDKWICLHFVANQSFPHNSE